MKKITIVMVFFCMAGLSTKAQWDWASSGNGNGNDYSGYIANDANGNVYIGGQFSSDSISFGGSVLTNRDASASVSNNEDCFFVRYNSSGNVVWAKNIGGKYDDQIKGIATDPAGNVIITGNFYSDSLYVDGTVLIKSHPLNHAIGDIFMAKYAPSGNLIWATNVGTTIGDKGVKSLAIDNQANIYITGGFIAGTIAFGSFTLTATSNQTNYFIVKYDPSGNAVWATNAGGANGYTMGISLTVDTNKNIFIAGRFACDSLIIGGNVLRNSGNPSSTYDIFIAKYDSTGTALWAKSAGGTANDWVYKLVADFNGNVYMMGSTQSTSISFGSFVYNNYNNIIVVKYNSGGNVVAANNSTSSNLYNIGVGNLATDAIGNLYIAGTFANDTLYCGSNMLINSNVGSNTTDILVMKCDSTGNVIYAVSAGGSGNENAEGISTDGSSVYISGPYSSNPLTIGSYSFSNRGAIDIFVAKLGTSTGIASLSDINESITISPNPSSGLFSIASSSLIKEVKVMNVLGEVVVHQLPAASATAATVDLSMHSKGIYFIHVQTDKGIISKKIIKE